MTDPGRAGCPELQDEELVGLQILVVAPQGPKHWDAVVGQGLSGWACPFLTSQAHEITQPSALGEATGSKLVTQAVRSALPEPRGAGSQRSCYSQHCFPSAWHPQIPQPGLLWLPWQADPSPDLHASSSLPREQTFPEPPSAMGQSSPHTSKRSQWQSRAPPKSSNSQPRLRVTRGAAAAPTAHQDPAQTCRGHILPCGPRAPGQQPAGKPAATTSTGNENPSCFDPATAAGQPPHRALAAP